MRRLVRESERQLGYARNVHREIDMWSIAKIGLWTESMERKDRRSEVEKKEEERRREDK